MNWSRVKSILIVLFSLINVLLLCMIGFHEYGISRRQRETFAQVKTLLAEHGIDVALDTLPQSGGMLPEVSVMNIAGNPRALASALLDAGYHRTVMENERYVYEQGEARLEVHEYAIAFTQPAAEEQTISERRARYLAGKVMEQMGVDQQCLSEGVVSQDGSRSTVTLCPVVFGQEMRGCELTITLVGEQVTEITGSFFIPVSSGGHAPEQVVQEPAAVLVDLLQNPDIGEGCRIVTMELCYFIQPEHVAERHVVVPAAYFISDDGGNTYIYDAGTGEYLMHLTEG